jgi:hypothetical protein
VSRSQRGGFPTAVITVFYTVEKKCYTEELPRRRFIVLAGFSNNSILDGASILVTTYKNYLNCLSTEINERFDRI